MIELIDSYPDFSGSFSDKRIGARANEALHRLTTGRSSSIRQVTTSDAAQKSFYRLFNNERFTEKGITDSLVKRCGALCKGRHVLCIQDTTEFNLTQQKGRLKANSGLGRTANSDVLGFMLHSSLVTDAHKTTALGYSSIKLWHREADAPDRHERQYQKLPISEKESGRWIEAANCSETLLEQAETITIVADRESDIYDLLAMKRKVNTHLLLRSNFDRRLKGGSKLIAHLDSLPVMHSYRLEVRGDIRKKQYRRTVTMELKWSSITLVKPKTCKDKTLAGEISIYVVEAKEKGSGNILWRLYTTHPVATVEQAIQIIEWYKQRWYIEQVHRLLKTDGFRIERSQLEQGWAIRKLTLLAMMATIRIIQMMLAYEDDTEEQMLEEVFTWEEQSCLEMISTDMEGETAALKNTAGKATLRWAAWVIARLGGWKGDKSQRKPGPIVLQKGLAKFYIMFEGWSIYKKQFKDVSTQ